MGENENCNGFYENLERFKIALETRNFEIGLFWRRSNYFLALNTAVMVGAVSSIVADLPLWLDGVLGIGFSLVGIFVSHAWVDVVAGSKYWQSYWEQAVIDMQESIGFSRNGSERRDYFSRRDAWTDSQVKKNLTPGKLFNEKVLLKPSVSGCMYGVAIFFSWGWRLMFILLFVRMGFLTHKEILSTPEERWVYPLLWL